MALSRLIHFHNVLQPGYRQVGGIRRNFSTLNVQTKPFSFAQLNQHLKPVIRRGTVTMTETTAQSKWIGRWLGTCAGMCFGAVVLGGLTRLTESGLSMVEWSAFGERPPLSHEDWVKEFEKYKQYPEYKQLKKGISLEEFKFIWHMEYGHRMWGRTIGAVFFLPAVYFWKRGYFDSPMKKRVVAFGALLGFQGLLGWYMVKSGLEDRFHGESDIPRVSQYRLAAHLGSALALYALFLWSSLGKLLPPQPIVAAQAVAKLKRLTYASKGMVFLTALSGAFVAGLDAGLVYNSYPLMAGRFVPQDMLALSPVLSNFTENPSTVQFDHRNLAHITLLVISSAWVISRRLILPRRVRLAVNCMAAMAWFQASLGVATLLMYVPTSLASSHQAGSLALLGTALWLSHELKHAKYIPK